MDAASGLHFIVARSRLHIEAAYKCQNCLRLSLAAETLSSNERTSTQVSGPEAANARNWRAPRWMPRYKEIVEFKDVPPHIAEAASEATLCLSAGAFRAVGSLARAVIEATCKHSDAKGRNLEERIDGLYASDRIRNHTKEQAHEVRHFGNDMAHGDFADPVTKEEAEEIIELMAEVLDEVYQSPARLQQRKAARLARKGESTPVV
ncbi:DUF4145 domain-containing protein [Enemella sp. A6]|uniref:DUF4145 domain-containing protein n=1 Tax=Enemella sp. A6 TaxID=3440152 RepID=UPI003EB73DD5